MKQLLFPLFLLVTSTSYADPPFVPTEQLVDFFNDNGISFTSPADYYPDGTGDEHKLFNYPDPANYETIAVNFEWHVGNFFSTSYSGEHLAVQLRGPNSGDPVKHTHRGRGLALGEFSGTSWTGCNNPASNGFFIEDFTKEDAGGKPDQLSVCKPMQGLNNNSIYRIDLHVSQTQVWVAIWEKVIISWPGGSSIFYIFLDESSCQNDPGPDAVWSTSPSPPRWTCKEDTAVRDGTKDSDTGNLAIGSAFLGTAPNDWSARQIYISHW